MHYDMQNSGITVYFRRFNPTFPFIQCYYAQHIRGAYVQYKFTFYIMLHYIYLLLCTLCLCHYIFMH